MVFGLFKSKPKEPEKTPPSKEVIDQWIGYVIENLIKGDYSSSFSSSLMLKKGEKLIFDVPNVELCEERSIKMKGGHQGFSIRIMKGVSYRFGSFEGGREMKVVPIDSGNFILTNKRIVYSGETAQRDFSLSKINTIDVIENGITLSRAGKTKTEYYLNFDGLELSFTITPEEGECLHKNTCIIC